MVRCSCCRLSFSLFIALDPAEETRDRSRHRTCRLRTLVPQRISAFGKNTTVQGTAAFLSLLRDPNKIERACSTWLETDLSRKKIEHGIVSRIVGILLYVIVFSAQKLFPWNMYSGI